MSTADGQTAVTPTPWAAASERSASDSPTTACLVMTYDVSSPAAIRPPIEAVLTMWPLPWRTISGYAACTPCTTPRMLTSMIEFQWSRVSSSVSPPMLMPALLNMRSSAPASAATEVTSDDTAAASVTSSATARAEPGPSHDEATAEAASRSRSAQHHVGAGVHQRPRERRADTGAGAGDDRGPAGEPVRRLGYWAHSAFQPSTSSALRAAGPA